MKKDSNAQNILSRKWMQEALLRLLSTKDLAEITITELTRTAGVSRVTYYRNYTDISDILFDYMDMQSFGLAGQDTISMYLPQFIRSYFDFFAENQVLIRCIQKNNMLARLFVTLENQINANSYLLVAAYGFENPYEISALVGMFTNIIMDWLRGGMKESIEEMTIIVYAIITKFNCVV